MKTIPRPQDDEAHSHALDRAIAEARSKFADISPDKLLAVDP